MLYDPKWEVPVETKADPFKLETLIVWLASQPPSVDYSYLCNGDCLLAQYFTAMGYENVCMFGDSFWHGDTKCPRSWGQDKMLRQGKGSLLPPRFNYIAFMGDHTFGAALARARAFGG